MFTVTMSEVYTGHEDEVTRTFKCGKDVATISLDCSPLPTQAKRYLILLENGEFSLISREDFSEVTHLIVAKFSVNHIVSFRVHRETQGSVASSLGLLTDMCDFNKHFPGVIANDTVQIFCDRVYITGKLLQADMLGKVIARINIEDISLVEVSAAKFRITI